MSSPFEISSRFIDDLIVASPLFATYLGVEGHDSEWDDFSPDGYEHKTELAHRVIEDMSTHLIHQDPDQRLAASVVTEHALFSVAAFDANDHLRDLAHMASPFQAFREIFEFVDHTHEHGARAAAERLETIGRALAGYQVTLRRGIASNEMASVRQAQAVLRQATELAGPDSAWHRLEQNSPIVDRMSTAVARAKHAMAEFAEFIRDEYLGVAPDEDGVGRERYVRAAESFLGMTADPDELYEWGWGEVDRLLSEMRDVGAEIDPTLDLPGVIGLMETSDELSVLGPDQLVDFVRERQERAIADLDGTHFDLADPIRTVSVQIAPPGGALGAYYRQPSEDFERPGGIYYSVGDQDRFPLYQEVSTAYHEGFPGHHLQIGTAMATSERLSRAQRVLIWYSGYGEGWAMYAERLMGELGYFERPEWLFGMLASQLFRAARVVVDIGIHLGFDIPDDAPMFAGDTWNFERAATFMEEVGLQTRDYAVSEVTRYVGWPGQAISYKVGEREILRLRADEQRRLGDRFDLKQFHARVLGSGEMGFDLLRRVVAEEFDR